MLLLGPLLSCAQSKSYKLVDAENGAAIPYASIILGPGKGTISNAEGFFSVDPKNLPSGTLKISCMGYRSVVFSPMQLKSLESTIAMEPAAINLNEVRVGGGIPSADQIVARVRNSLEKNYALAAKDTYRIFYRESEYMQFEDLVLELEKDSDLSRQALKSADARLRTLGEDIVRSNPKKFLDFKGLWKSASDSSATLRVARVTELVDQNKDYSMENIQDRAQSIIMEHLDSTENYKVKSGMFKIEDEMSPVAEFREAEDQSDSIEVDYLKRRTASLADLCSWKEGTRLREFLDPDLYEYTFLKATYFDGHYVYALGFEPRRRKAKYSGTLYVDTSTYGILKADFAYARGRRGSKVNLKLVLGIKYVEHLSQGTVIFKRNEVGGLFPYYTEAVKGNYIYLHRDLKFIENSPRRKKVRFDFLLEGEVRERQALLAQPLESGIPAGPGGSADGKVKLIRLNRYEPGIWQDAEVIEPLEEVKRFKVEQP